MQGAGLPGEGCMGYSTLNHMARLKAGTAHRGENANGKSLVLVDRKDHHTYPARRVSYVRRRGGRRNSPLCRIQFLDQTRHGAVALSAKPPPVVAGMQVGREGGSKRALWVNPELRREARAYWCERELRRFP